MNQKGVKSVFLIGPNYAAGKDMLAGVKSTFKGEVVGEEYTVWPSQLDFSAELSQGAQLEGRVDLRVLSGCRRRPVPQPIYPGRDQGSRSRSTPRLPSTNCRCRCRRKMRSAFPARRNGLTTCRTRRTSSFVEDYRKKYPGLRPTFYGAQSYDAAQLINSAVVAVKGDTARRTR